MRHSALLVISALLCSPALARGQATFDSLPRWSLSVEFPSGGGTTLGMWRLLAERLNLGIGVRIHRWSVDNTIVAADGTRLLDANTTETNISIEPAVRLYLGTQRPVKPFLLGAVGYTLQDRNSVVDGGPPDDDTDIYDWLARIALGAEWLPLSSVSFAVWTGLQVSRFTREDTLSPGVLRRFSRIDFHSLTGALTFQIYF